MSDHGPFAPCKLHCVHTSSPQRYDYSGIAIYCESIITCCHCGMTGPGLHYLPHVEPKP